jgi:O-acetyl-ADP-ribose deacetylase (regulator of RNase III)
VAGAIHKIAGPELWAACKTLGGCRTGEAKLTAGFNLKAKYVLHTVGPVYRGRLQDYDNLKLCYLNSLMLAEKNGIKTISFPAISTGAFGYPVKKAAKISLSTVKNYLMRGTSLEAVRFVLYSQSTYKHYLEILETLMCTHVSKSLEQSK